MPGAPLVLLLALCLACAATGGCDDHGTDGDADADVGPDGDADADGDAPPIEQELSIVTWNLENFPASAETVGRVAGLLADMDPDIVAVQEIVDVAAFNRLISGLPGYAGTVNDDPGGDMRVGLIHRTSRVEVIEYQTLFSGDWHAFPRPPLMARLEVLGPGGDVSFDFIVLVLHLKARLDAESQARRLEACQRLEEWVAAQVAAGDEADLVLLGDWNDELTDWGSDNVFGAFLDSPDLYTFLTLPLEESGNYSFLPFDSFLDHVLITADALDEYGAGTTTVVALDHTVDDYQTHVSDHRPVLATFEIP